MGKKWEPSGLTWSNDGPERLAANSAKEEATLTSGPRMSTMRMAGTSPEGTQVLVNKIKIGEHSHNMT